MDAGVRALVVTPHLDGSLTTQPERLEARLAELDAAWVQLKCLADEQFPDLRAGARPRGDARPPELDLSDARVRLAGTRFALVEFPYMNVPPRSIQAVFELKMKGWVPVIAHPERYQGVDGELRVVEEWRRVGGLLQVNAGSLLGYYGERAKLTAWRLLRRGWVSYLSSDYHARGRFPLEDARAKLEEKGGEEQALLLLETNGARLLEGLEPEAVPPIELARRPWWKRLVG